MGTACYERRREREMPKLRFGHVFGEGLWDTGSEEDSDNDGGSDCNRMNDDGMNGNELWSRQWRVRAIFVFVPATDGTGIAWKIKNYSPL